MLVVMHKCATPEQLETVLSIILSLGLKAHPLPGSTRTAIGITGNLLSIQPDQIGALPGVMEIIKVTKPYKLASREFHEADTIVTLGESRIGTGHFSVTAGPCSVENELIMMKTADFIRSQGLTLMRAGAFKPRTSPYAFQGMGREGLKLLERVRQKTGVLIVTEVMETEEVEAVGESADIVQIGTRNMQNYPLLRKVGKLRKPILLKRGMSATLEEWLMAAEYILAGGNTEVILCERGVRTFNDHSRNTLDLSVVPPVKALCHLPVVIDPSHATGKRAYVPPMTLAGLACGAHGAMIEIHPDPDKALSDGLQTIDFIAFEKLMGQLRELAKPLGVVIC
ncbi:MAG: 3-deoxy-7-phosphoheptulonate synthase [Planctomycetota bacterium]|nr:3-deoxy-7-phosphoheptulonate synthase [Planctomycetota bacterium]